MIVDWIIAVAATVVLYLLASLKILAENERAVVIRFGRVLPEIKGPGMVFFFPPVERLIRLSLRIEATELPVQELVASDTPNGKLKAVIYFRLVEPRLAVLEVSNFLYTPSAPLQTRLRSVLGKGELNEILSHQRTTVNLRLQSILISARGLPEHQCRMFDPSPWPGK